jgi:hypothetical protein
MKLHTEPRRKRRKKLLSKEQKFRRERAKMPKWAMPML